MSKYRMIKDVTAVKFDGTIESCERILKMLGLDSKEFSIHIYGNARKTVSFRHKRKDEDFVVAELDYVVLEDNGEWGIKWHGTFEDDYTEVCN